MTSSSVNVLLVDDEDTDREAIVRSLRRSKIANPVITARDGVEALEVLRGGDGIEAMAKPVIVILDWKMPRMNGLEFLDELRADPDLRETLVFVLTTSNEETDVLAAYRHLVAGYILKDTAGADFTRLVELLDAYWKIVEIPA